jgi:uncharacterized protein YjbI with pentapeptide repeats
MPVLLEKTPEFYAPVHLPGHKCFGPRADRLVASGQHWSAFVPLEVAPEDLRAQSPRSRKVEPFTDFSNYVSWAGKRKPPQISSFVGHDLTMSVLSCADFSGLDFSKAHQSRAYQYGLSDMLGGHGPSIPVDSSLFTSAKFHGTQFCHLIGEWPCFCKANFQEADLNGSWLTAACFIDARIVESNLRGSKIIHSTFFGSDLSGSNFNDSNLVGTCFSQAGFTKKTTFKGANLSRTCFRDTSLRQLLLDSDILFPSQEVIGSDFRVDQTIAGARLPSHVRLDLAERGAIVDLPSAEDWPEEAFYEGYLDRSS